MYSCNQIKDICTWNTVALQWKQHFYKVLGEYLPINEYRKVQKINTKVQKVFGRRFINKENNMEYKHTAERNIKVITPVYNAEKYIEKCIRSVCSQDYDNWEMYIINDKSNDNTHNIVNDLITKLDLWNKVVLINNENNLGAVRNQIETLKIFSKDPEDIIILLDGDDWLVNNPNIFTMYNNLWEDGVRFSYGSCWSVIDNIPLIAQEYPPEVKQNKLYRDYKFNWNMPYTHLRVISRSLIDTDDLTKYKDNDGNWLKAGGDTSVFYSSLENCDPDRVYCNPEVVMNYNDASPINDYKVNSEEQTKNASIVLDKKLAKKKNDTVKNNDNRNDTVKNILIAIPTARYIEPQTFKSIYDLEVPEGYKTYFQFFYGYQVDQVRNLIADWTVKGYDYLFSVDHDIAFPPDTLKKLLAANKPVVSGVYRQRLENEQIIEIFDHDLRHMPINMIDKNTLQEVGACGFGCVLVKKEVFLSIGYPHFVYKSAIDHKDTFSEDLYFCKRAREEGHTIWCDGSIICDHYGQKVFKVHNEL